MTAADSDGSGDIDSDAELGVSVTAGLASIGGVVRSFLCPDPDQACARQRRHGSGPVGCRPAQGRIRSVHPATGIERERSRW